MREQGEETFAASRAGRSHRAEVAGRGGPAMAQAKARGALLKGFRSGELQMTVDKMEAGAAQPDAASEAAAERERVRKLKMRAELDKMSQRML